METTLLSKPRTVLGIRPIRQLVADAAVSLLLGTSVSACARSGSEPARGGGDGGAVAFDEGVELSVIDGLVPLPATVEPRTGHFTLRPSTAIVVEEEGGADAQRVAAFLAAALRPATGLGLAVVAPGSGGPGPHIRLRLDGAPVAPESYLLEVAADGIALSAPTGHGLFDGVQTLRQLLPPEIESATRVEGVAWTVPAVRIDDEPRLAYRGFMLDSSRHFFSVDFVKRLIDVIARYKLDVFHWHLTDDQGWRLEIQRFPKLTQVGAYRDEGGAQPYGGFYTQDEVRDVVRYAQERFVTVVPEIEMPGHSRAALAAYPEYSCTGGPFTVPTSWGIFKDIDCPSEETFAFLEGVLTETIELFPESYIHIGGDEVPKDAWQASSVAAQVMAREGLTTYDDLETYFVARIGTFLASKGRRLVGWDEITQGGTPSGAIVMCWRGTDPGARAAREGTDVVMSPAPWYYLDQYQADPATEPPAIGGFVPLESAYGLDPVPAALMPADARHIIGSQGNLWTEYIATNEHAEYMAFPRELAIAERAWTNKSADYAGFRKRLGANARHLDALGVHYAKHFLTTP